MFGRACQDVARFYRRAWWWSALLQLVSGLLVALPLAVIAQLGAVLLHGQGTALVGSGDLVVFTVVLLAIIVLVCLPLSLVGLSATVRVVNDTLAGRRRPFGSALAEGFRRLPALLAAAVITLFGTLVLIGLTPLLVLVGVLAMVPTLVLAVLRRRRPGLLPRWPSWRTLAWVAVPFGLALRFVAGAMFFAPAVVLEARGPLAALRAGAAAAAPRRLRVVGVVVLGVVVTTAVQMGAAWLGSLAHATGGLLGQIVVQLLTVALPVILVTVLFRLSRRSDAHGLPTSRARPYRTGVLLRRRPRLRIVVPSTVRRVALVMPFVIVLAAVGVAPTAAEAAPAALVLTVDSAADPTDAATLAAQATDCIDASGTCTLRAAIAAAQTEAASQSAIRIAFADSYTVALAAPLSFDTNAANDGAVGSGGDGGDGGDGPSGDGGASGGDGGGAGVLQIDGAGHHVVLDGQGATQVLSFRSTAWAVQLDALQISHGAATGEDGLGGAVDIDTVAASTIDDVTFDHDTATIGGGAVTMAHGPLTITDSTFDDDTAGTGPNPEGYLLGGADLYALYGAAVTIQDSTFAGYSGASLLDWVAAGDPTITVDDSLFDVAGGTSVVACTGGGFAGATNVVSGTDTSCPGTVADPVTAVGDLVEPPQGGPAILPLVPDARNTAITGAGSGGVACTATDQRGLQRPTIGCDAGAVELDPTTSTTVTASSVRTVHGNPTTFTASTGTADGGTTVTNGTVAFTVDGTALGDPVAVTAGTASTTTTALTTGSHTVTATYLPVDAHLLSGSTSAALTHTVTESDTTVFLRSSANPGTVGGSVDVTATVASPSSNVAPTGTVTLHDTTDGEPGTVVGTATLQDGSADFDVSSLTAGKHALVAQYGGDAGDGAASSAVFQQVLRTATTVSAGASATALEYGQSTTVSVTVPATGTLATPTGSVTVEWAGGIRAVPLDADGTASTVLDDIAVGSSAISVTYGGDDRYAPATAPDIAVQVAAAPTTTTLATSDDAIQYGVPVSLTAVVGRQDGPAPTGRVVFSSGGTELGSVTLTPGAGTTSTATFVPAPDQLPVGAPAVQAVFDPSGGYLASSSSPATITVSRARATVTVTSGDASAPVHATVVLTATAAGRDGSLGIPDGSVEFLDGTTDLGTATLSGGTATLTTTFASSGDHSITARYPGSASFGAVTSDALVQREVAEDTVTTLTLTPGSPIRYGAPLRFDVTVDGASSGVPAAGEVEVQDGSDTVATVVLTDGSATGTITGQTTGSHAYRAVFVPSTSDTTRSTSPVVPYSVGAATTTTALTFSQPSSSEGDPVTLTARVDSADVSPTGSVTFTTGDTTLGTASLVAGAPGTASASITAALPESADYPDAVRDVVAVYAPNGGSADFVGSSATEPYAVARGTVALGLELEGSVAGSAQQLVATARTLTGTGHPTGTVTFSAGESTLGRVDLVDGVATLTGLHLSVGTVALQAVYSSTDPDFDPPSPSFATDTVTVTQGTPTVELHSDATGAIDYGDAVALTATVATSSGLAPIGAVDFVATGPAGAFDLGTASLGGTGPTTATLSTRAVPVGTQTITAQYLGDGDLVGVTSDGITVTASTTPTTTAVTVSPDSSQPGQPVTLRARTSTADGSATSGTVAFLVDGVPVGTAAVGGDGTATLSYAPQAAGTISVEARYSQPGDGFGPSTATATHDVVRREVEVQLSAGTTGFPVGHTADFTVRVLAGAIATGARTDLPTGDVVVSDASGERCTATLSPSPVTAGIVEGTCGVAVEHAGLTDFTATYVGDALDSGGESNAVTVLAFTSSTTVTLTSPDRWIAGSRTTLTWKVTGPTDVGAPVTIRDDNGVVCSSTALSGTCPYTVPTGTTESDVVLSYAGSTVWAPASTILDKEITTCVQLDGVTVSPEGSGTATLTTEPDCGASGYLPGDVLQYDAVPADGWAFSFWDGGDTNTTHDVVAQGTRMGMTANFARACVAVTLKVVGGETYGGQEIESAARPNCPAGWIGSDASSSTGSFRVGTSIDLDAVVPSGPPPQKFYQWSGLAAGADVHAPTQTYIVTSAPTQTVTATFGPTCVHDVRVVQPAGGSVVVDGPNCTDDIGPGYVLGSTLSVSTKATGTGYFGNWSSNVHPLTATSTGATGTITVGKTNQPVTADYDECVSFSVSAPGVAYLGQGNAVVNSSASATPTGDCPNRGAGWYLRGTTVQISTTGIRGATFGGWTSTLPLAQMATAASNSLVVNASGTATAGWYEANECKPFTLTAEPAGALTTSATFPNAPDQSCPDGQVNSALSQSGQDLTLTATPTSGHPLIGWTGTTSVWKDAFTTTSSTVPPTTANPRTVRIAAGGSFTAWACEAIDTTLTLVSPNGTSHSEPLPASGDFASAAPGPDCPLAVGAYTVGQDVFPQATEDSPGYTFLGWSGAITSTDAYPTQSIALDGAASSVALTAEYQVNCFTLTTNTTNTAVSPAPNCPDTDASQHEYIGGTEITFQAIGNAGHDVFRGFTGDMDGQSGDVAWMAIAKDSGVYSDYTSRSAGEVISDVADTIGNGVAVAAKKAVGVAASAVAAFVMGDNPVLLVASIAVLVGEGVQGFATLIGASSTGLTNFTNGITDLSQMLTFLQASATCATVWSAGGSASQAAASNDTLEGGGGTAAGNEILAARDKAAAERAAEVEAQNAAMTDAYDARLANQLSTSADASASGVSSYLSSAADSVSAKASAAAEKLAGPIETAGRLGDVGIVGYATYQEITDPSSGWDSSAASAWTSGGDVYTNCLVDSIPPYFGVPPQ